MSIIPYKASNDDVKKNISQASFHKTILLTHEYPPFSGGVATYCYELGKAAKESELLLEIYSPKGSLAMEGASLTHLECGATLNPLHLLQMVAALKKRESKLEGCSLILGSIAAHRAAMLLRSMGQLKKCRLFSLIHGSEVFKFQKNFFWRILAKNFFEKVEAIFVASEFSRSLVRKNFGDKKIVLAPCACSTAAAIEVLKENKDEKFRILTLARIHPRKGQFETALALAKLPSNLKSKLIYQIAGKGDSKYLQKVLDFCAQNQIACEYLGKVDDSKLAQTYANCDLFVMTSRSLPDSVEGFGISYLEAAWHGKPSIAFRTGGVGEAVLDKKTGFLVEECDIKSLTQTIAKLMEDHELRNFLGQQALTFARSFDWKKTSQIFAQTINN